MQGDQVGCPHCNQLTVLGAAPVIQPPVLSNAQNPNLSNCPDCGRTVSLRATSCPHCGGPITLAKPSPSASSKPQGLSAPAVVTPPQAPKAPVSRLEKVIICTVALGAIALAPAFFTWLQKDASVYENNIATTPKELKGDVAVSIDVLRVSNWGREDWRDVRIFNNGGSPDGYMIAMPSVKADFGSQTAPLAQFTKGQQRFGPRTMAVTDVYIVTANSGSGSFTITRR